MLLYILYQEREVRESQILLYIYSYLGHEDHGRLFLRLVPGLRACQGLREEFFICFNDFLVDHLSTYTYNFPEHVHS